LVPVIVSLVSRMGAIDLAYHVRVGEEILRGAFPRVDTFTFTAAGEPWTDQQWLAQVVFALGFRAGGWPTLAALQALLVGISFGLLYLTCRRGGTGPRLSAILTLVGFIVASPSLVLRPQLIAVPLFAGALWAIAGRGAHPRQLWLVPVLAALGVNVHGSFPLFVLVIGLAWLDDLRAKRSEARRTLSVGFVTLAATAFNPFGPSVWPYAYALSSNPIIRETISEWAPVTIDSVAGVLMLASGFAIVLYLIRRPVKTPWTHLLSLAIFFVLAMAAQRAIVWWALVATATAALLIGEEARVTPREVEKEPASDPIAPAVVLLTGLMAAIVVLLPWWRGSSFDRFLDVAPPGLTEAVQRELPPGARLLADQTWGSWFEFAVPQVPVFVDSRIELYDRSVWQDYGEVGFAGAGWRQVLERWDIDAIAGRPDWELLPYLRADDAWRLAYEGDDGVLFVRAEGLLG
jgi:hypothetical protein